jgi:hypothetical protein
MFIFDYEIGDENHQGSIVEENLQNEDLRILKNAESVLHQNHRPDVV